MAIWHGNKNGEHDSILNMFKRNNNKIMLTTPVVQSCAPTAKDPGDKAWDGTGWPSPASEVELGKAADDFFEASAAVRSAILDRAGMS